MEGNKDLVTTNPYHQLAKLAQEPKPTFWIVSEGASVAGEVLRFEQFTNFKAEQHAVIIKTEEGERVSVILNTYLQTGFKQKQITVGDYVSIKCLGQGSSKYGNPFKKYELVHLPRLALISGGVQ